VKLGTFIRIVVAVLAMCSSLYAADWSRIGADAGLSKYSPDNIPEATTLQLQYVKRFYSKYTPNRGNFFYGSSVVVRNSKAIIVADDRQAPPASSYVSFMQFDWQTGQTQAYYNTPWPLSQNDREVDSHHYTNAIIWHDDGRVYMRRGGDNSSTRVFLPDTGQLIQVFRRDAAGNVLAYGIDATALMQTYRDALICRFGHTYETRDFCATSISEACFVAPNQTGQPDILGRWTADVGVSVPPSPGADGLYGSTGRYGDIPKCANGVCVMAGLVYNKYETWPNNIKIWLEATDLVTGQTLWTRTWVSDTGGNQGFGTSISDYWRFIATDSGHYIFFTRAGQQPVTVRALDLRTGDQKWSKELPDGQERPLLAYHAGCLYVIGRADQYKLDISTGYEMWHTSNIWPNDRGYVLGNHDAGSSNPLSQDPMYRPVVLTNETLWFVDGDGLASSYTPSGATLVGVSTQNGQVIMQIDLRNCYSGTPNESLLVVNDVMLADGLLGVLVGVVDAQSPYPHTNGMDYQDLYVFRGTKLGDINRDGYVDYGDLMIFAYAWLSRPGDPNWVPAADIDGSGFVDGDDLVLLAYYWGG
jgi:hypothetical protein